MNSEEFRALQEAYNQVYELDEVLDTPQKTQSYAAKNAASAVGAFVRGDTKTLSKRFEGSKRGMKKIENRKDQKEETDLYDLILSHLLDEGYADTYEAAEVMMVNMSEDWREEIVEASAAAKRGLPEPHRGVTKDINARAADSMRKTPSGRRQLQAQAAGHRQRQTPEEQAKRKEKDSNLERINRINARPRTTKEKNLAGHITRSGRLGS